jgi:hypothetical protein
VKRAARVFAAFVFLAFFAMRAHGESPLRWANSARTAAGLQALLPDEAAMRTAEAYAAVLAGLGRISHTGPDGSDALTRYFRAGGTSARVGEIIGAGPGLPDVQSAWLESADHRASLLRKYWTHAGWGAARSGNAVVWVMLFVQVRVAGLTVGEDADGALTVSGRFVPEDADAAALLCGTSQVAPESWDPLERRFFFRVKKGADVGYVRLGYLNAGGFLVITDVLTSPRGRVSPPG